MAINLSQAFHRTSGNPIDESMALTKAEMLTTNDNLMPSFYFTVCQDDGKFYLYDKTNTVDPTTGKFRVFEGGGGSYTAGDGINIDQNNEISTDNLQSGDMDDIVTPLPAPITEGHDLGDIDDVTLTNPSDGDALVYDATNHVWVNGAGSGGDSSLSSAVTSNLAVGAIASGTTLAQGTTFTEFVQKLLITEIAPTIGFSITKSGNVAYGGSYTETLTVNVSNMGTAKKIKTIAWYEGSTLKQTDTIDSTTTGSWTYTMGTATTDSTTFKAIITYTKSNDADDTQTKTSSINFYYNKFYGGVSDLNPTEATVEALTSALATGKGGTYSFTVTAGRICYAYPKSLGALTSIKDGNGFSLFDSFTRTEQTYTQNSTSVVYYRYVLTDATTVASYSVIFA